MRAGPGPRAGGWRRRVPPALSFPDLTPSPLSRRRAPLPVPLLREGLQQERRAEDAHPDPHAGKGAGPAPRAAEVLAGEVFSGAWGTQVRRRSVLHGEQRGCLRICVCVYDRHLGDACFKDNEKKQKSTPQRVPIV